MFVFLVHVVLVFPLLTHLLHPIQVAGSIPIDVYFNAKRSDYWALASDASREQAKKVRWSLPVFHEKSLSTVLCILDTVLQPALFLCFSLLPPRTAMFALARWATVCPSPTRHPSRRATWLLCFVLTLLPPSTRNGFVSFSNLVAPPTRETLSFRTIN